MRDHRLLQRWLRDDEDVPHEPLPRRRAAPDLTLDAAVRALAAAHLWEQQDHRVALARGVALDRADAVRRLADVPAELRGEHDVVQAEAVQVDDVLHLDVHDARRGGVRGEEVRLDLEHRAVAEAARVGG